MKNLYTTIRKCIKTTGHFLPILGFILLFSTASIAATFTSGSSFTGNWSNPSAWTITGATAGTGTIPGATDNVVIGATAGLSTVTLDIPGVTVANLVINYGTLQGANNLTISGNLTVNYPPSVIALTGNLTVGGTLTWFAGTIGPTSGSNTVTITGASTCSTSFGGVARNTNFTMTGGGSLNGRITLTNTTLNIASTFTVSGLSSLGHGIGSSSNVNITGTLNQTNSTFQVSTNLTCSGALNVAANATLSFTGGTSTLVNNITFASTATLMVNGGTLNLSGNYTAAGKFTFQNTNSKLGGTGNLTVNGNAIFSGGTIDNQGDVNIIGTLTVNGACNLGQINSGTMNVTGAMTMSAMVTLVNRTFNLNGGGTINSTNPLSGFTMTNSNVVVPATKLLFVDGGSITNSSPTDISTVTINGELRVGGLVSKTLYNCTSGTFTLIGSFIFWGGNLPICGTVSYPNTSYVQFNQGVYNYTQDLPINSNIIISGGTVNLQVPETFSSLIINGSSSNGILNLSSNLTVTGNLDVSTNGLLSGTGNLSINGTTRLLSGTLNNTGDVTIGGTTSIDNDGTFAPIGTVQCNSAFTQSGGTFSPVGNAQFNTTLTQSSGIFSPTTATVSGISTISGGTFAPISNAALNGKLTWTGGTIGATTSTAGSAITVNAGADFTTNPKNLTAKKLIINGNLLMTNRNFSFPPATLTMNQGATLEIPVGSTFTAGDNIGFTVQILNGTGPLSIFNLKGILTGYGIDCAAFGDISGSSNTANQLVLRNGSNITGTVTGSLVLYEGNHDITGQLLSPGVLSINGGNVTRSNFDILHAVSITNSGTLSGTTNINTTGLIYILNGNLKINGSVTTTDELVLGNYLPLNFAPTGNVSVRLFNWFSGKIGDALSNSNSTVTVSGRLTFFMGSYNLAIEKKKLTPTGLVTWSSTGDLDLMNDAIFEIPTGKIIGCNAPNITNSAGNGTVLINGHFVKSASTQSINAAIVNNGILEQSNGTLTINGYSGNGKVINGGTLQVNTVGGLNYPNANLTNNGAMTGNAINFNGSVQQTVSGNGSMLSVNVQNANDLLFSNSHTITNLTLGTGKIQLQNGNLGLGNITGASPLKYIVTNGTGAVVRTVGTTNTLFPIGKSNYTPITISQATGSDPYEVRVSDDIDAAYPLQGTAFVKKEWNISRQPTNTTAATIKAEWNTPTDEGAGFTSSSARLLHYDASAFAWSALPVANKTVNCASGVCSLTQTDVTNFSPFAVGLESSIPPCNLTMPSVPNALFYCQNASASELTATGTDLLWYSTATGGVGSTTAPTPSTINVGTTSFFVSQTVSTCESPRAEIQVTISGPTSYTFTATNGEWNEPTNWLPANVPLECDNVTIPINRTVTMNNTGDISVNNLTLLGNLESVYNLIVKGDLSVTNGSSTNFGNVTVNGNLTVNGNFTKTGNGIFEILSTTVNNGIINTSDNTLALSAYSGSGKIENNGYLYINTVGGLNYQNAVLINNATISGNPIILNGTTQQTIEGTGSINSLKLDNPSGVNMTGSQTIETDLAFTSGKIQLGINDLTIAANATITGADATKYIQTNSTGNLVRYVEASDVLFPIGESNYTPATINQAFGTDVYAVRVSDGIDATHPLLGTQFIGKEWGISRTSGNVELATIKLEWNPSDVGVGYNATLAQMLHYNSSITNWEPLPIGNRSASTANSLTQTGVTNFSPFAVGLPVFVLPVELLSFKGTPQYKTSFLTWETAVEQNMAHFDIESSSDGKTFSKIGSQKAKGQGSTYNFTDEGPLPIESGQVRITTYYRLKMVENDGSFSYSNIISVAFGKDLTVKAFPNPVQNELSIDVISASKQLEIEVIDVLGRSIYQKNEPNTEGYKSLTINTLEWLSGIYFLKISDGKKVFQQKIVKR